MVKETTEKEQKTAEDAAAAAAAAAKSREQLADWEAKQAKLAVVKRELEVAQERLEQKLQEQAEEVECLKQEQGVLLPAVLLLDRLVHVFMELEITWRSRTVTSFVYTHFVITEEEMYMPAKRLRALRKGHFVVAIWVPQAAGVEHGYIVSMLGSCSFHVGKGVGIRAGLQGVGLQPETLADWLLVKLSQPASKFEINYVTSSENLYES
eukprot:1143912-Pelagomonas_calceolata.AAC.2